LPPKPPTQAAEEADAVFEATVRNIEGRGGSVRVTMEVTRVWKGEPGAEALIRTNDSSAACGRNFDVGTAYLVYAYRDDAGLADNLCTRTMMASEAEEDFAALGPAEPPAASEPSTPPATGGSEGEPPRIDPNPEGSQPPPSAPGPRGCSMGEKPHAGSAWALGLALVVACRRRGAIGSCPNRS
jgi:hypothetical protein